jgi:prepilin-type N-terminal cleavage/methylation domain-containing protein
MISRADNPKCERPGRGFTLIEILVVIVVLGVLLSLGVSAGFKVLQEAKRKETVTIQQTILDAIQAYRHSDPDEALPYKLNAQNTMGMTELYDLLTANATAMETLRNLPDGAIDAAGHALRDSYGTAMRYERDSGFGGTPQLISAGPDTNFGTTADNIYSKEQ